MDQRHACCLLLTLAFGFTGYLLPWNELSFFATRVGTDIAAAVPGIGEFHRPLHARRATTSPARR